MILILLLEILFYNLVQMHQEIMLGLQVVATGTLNIINAGIGYTPSSGIATFTGINLQTITGKGTGAVGSITINNGVAIGATVTSGGSGYQIGDVLGISSIGAVNVGINARLSLSNISNLNQIIVDNVQGDFTTGVGKTIQYDRSWCWYN
jgi:hypothetical protein